MEKDQWQVGNCNRSYQLNMSFTDSPISLIILAGTILASLAAFNNPELKKDMLYNPYLVKEHSQWYRMFSHAFIHSDYMHLAFNMYVFYGFGVNLEITFTDPLAWSSTFRDIPFWGVTKGRVVFTLLYIGGFLFATLPAYKKHSDNPGYNSLGASGAVSAVLLAYILLFPLHKLSLLFIPIPIPAFIMGILLFAYESYMNKKGGTRIAHDAHIYGAIFGLLFIAIANFQFIGHFIKEMSQFSFF